MRELEYYNLYGKCERVLKSCKTRKQAFSARRFIALARAKVNRETTNKWAGGAARDGKLINPFWDNQFAGLLRSSWAYL